MVESEGACTRVQGNPHQVRDFARATRHDFFVNWLRFKAPLPGVLKRRDLRGGLFAALFFEQQLA